MDHSWGRNVLKYGLIDTGATLAARSPGVGVQLIRTNARYIVPGYSWAYFMMDTSPVIFRTLFPWGDGYPHFPYGYIVEPDEPL